MDGDISTNPYQPTVKSNTIDVTLRNTGQQPSLITELQGNVVFAQELDDCEPIGDGVRATAHYTMTLPENPPAVPFSVTRPIDFKVAPIAEAVWFGDGVMTRITQMTYLF